MILKIIRFKNKLSFVIELNPNGLGYIYIYIST